MPARLDRRLKRATSQTIGVESVGDMIYVPFIPITNAGVIHGKVDSRREAGQQAVKG